MSRTSTSGSGCTGPDVYLALETVTPNLSLRNPGCHCEEAEPTRQSHAWRAASIQIACHWTQWPGLPPSSEWSRNDSLFPRLQLLLSTSRLLKNPFDHPPVRPIWAAQPFLARKGEEIMPGGHPHTPAKGGLPQKGGRPFFITLLVASWALWIGLERGARFETDPVPFLVYTRQRPQQVEGQPSGYLRM